MAEAVQGGNTANEKMFYLEEVDKCCSENRLLVKNLRAIFSYVVSGVLNTMTVYKLRGYYLLLEEKDRKIFRNPGLSAPNCIVSCCSSWLAIRLSQETLPCLDAPDQLTNRGCEQCWGKPCSTLVPACSWQYFWCARKPERRAVTSV